MSDSEQHIYRNNTPSSRQSMFSKRPVLNKLHTGNSGISQQQNDDDRTDDAIGAEYLPDRMDFTHTTSQQPSELRSNSIPIAASNDVEEQQQQHVLQHRDSDQYLPGLEFNINAQDAMSPTLGMAESEWKAIPFSTRRRLKAAVQEQIGTSLDSAVVSSLPSSAVANKPVAKPIPFSKRRSRTSTMYPEYNSNNSAGSDSTGCSPAFAFLSKLGNSSTDTTNGNDDSGDQVGDYIIGSLIGYGGFSKVKEAHTMENGKKVVRAVKIVSKSNPASTQEYMERIRDEFDHEVSLWKTLNHENILRLRLVEDMDQATYCFTDKIDGGTLFDAVKHHRNTLDLNLIKQYVYQIGSALLYLHENMRVVHRDVKLENCLVDTLPNGQTRILLCDFGMSEYFRDEERYYDKLRPNHVIGPSDTSSLFNQYHYHHASSGSFSIAESRTSTRRNTPTSSPGNKSPRTMSGLAALTPLNHEKRGNNNNAETEDPLTSHHSRRHHSHLSARQSAAASPHTPSSTPTQIRESPLPQPQGQHNQPPSMHEQNTQNFGSLPYASPELLQSSVPIVDPSVDMWSFGVVIHALYMGHLPWHHAFLPKLRMMILQGHWDQQAMVQRGGYEAMEVTKACLDMDPTTRATIRQVVESKLLQHERRKYGPRGKRRDDEELRNWSVEDND